MSTNYTGIFFHEQFFGTIKVKLKTLKI